MRGEVSVVKDTCRRECPKCRWRGGDEGEDRGEGEGTVSWRI